jgi:hypothetical protein
LAFNDPAAIHREMFELLPNFLPDEEGQVSDPNYRWWKASMN